MQYVEHEMASWRGAAGSRAYTFIEVVVSMSILAFGLAGMWGMLHFAFHADHFSKGLTLATACAAEKLEELIAMDYDTVTSGRDTLPRCARRWQVSEDRSLQTKEILMTVSWSAVDGSDKSITIRTLRSRR